MLPLSPPQSRRGHAARGVRVPRSRVPIHLLRILDVRLDPQTRTRHSRGPTLACNRHSSVTNVQDLAWAMPLGHDRYREYKLRKGEPSLLPAHPCQKRLIIRLQPARLTISTFFQGGFPNRNASLPLLNRQIRGGHSARTTDPHHHPPNQRGRQNSNRKLVGQPNIHSPKAR